MAEGNISYTESDKYNQKKKCPYTWCRKITNAIENDVNEAIKGNQWSLSSYGPFAWKPSISNYKEDLSFEEARLFYYEAKKTNTLENFQQQFAELCLEIRVKNSYLLNLQGDLVNNINKIYETNVYTTCCGLKKGQQSKANAFVKKNNETEIPLANYCPDNLYTLNKIDKIIIDLMLVDMLPHNIVQGIAFQRLHPYNLGKGFESEEYFRTTLMPFVFNKVKEEVIRTLEGTKWLTISTHILPSADNSYSLLCFIAHDLNASTRKQLVLGASILENNYKDANITEKFLETVADFKLEEKVVLNIYNNESISNTKLTSKSLECVGHILHLVTHDAIFKEERIQEIIAKSSRILNDFKRSQQACNYLKNINIQDKDTKWINTYLMMEDLIKHKSEISFCSNENGNTEILSHDEWSLLQDIVKVLESFYETFINLTASASTVSLVIPLITNLATKIGNLEVAQDLKNAFKNSLSKRFEFMETSPFLLAATLLDPRFKNRHLNENQYQIAENEIFDFFTEFHSINSTKITDAKQHEFIMSLKTEKKQLSYYIRKPLEPEKSNVFEHWSKSLLYRNLKRCAVKYLSAAPSIIASEEFLNSGGRLYAERKPILKEVNPEQLLICHYNIQLLDFKY